MFISCKNDSKDISKAQNSPTIIKKESNLNDYKNDALVKTEPKKVHEESAPVGEYIPPATTIPQKVKDNLNTKKDNIHNEKTKQSTSVKPSPKKKQKKKNQIKKKAKIKKKVVAKKDASVDEVKPKGKLFFPQEIYNFGVITEGDEFDHTFKFRNTGQGPIAIENIEVSCGCTTPTYPFIDIRSGQLSELSVHYSSKNKWAHQKPSMTIYTNGDPAVYTIYLEGDVHEKVEEKEVKEDKPENKVQPEPKDK